MKRVKIMECLFTTKAAMQDHSDKLVSGRVPDLLKTWISKKKIEQNYPIFRFERQTCYRG